MNLQDIGKADRLVSLSNGAEVVEYFDKIFEDIKSNPNRPNVTSIQPVALLLLDINMPIMTGIETLTAVKEKFQIFNK